MMDDFGPLPDLSDSQFCFFMRSQWLTFLFCYEISIMVGSVPLLDFNDDRFVPL